MFEDNDKYNNISGTPVDKLKEDQDVHFNYERIRQLQELRNKNNVYDEGSSMEKLAENINSNIEYIDDDDHQNNINTVGRKNMSLKPKMFYRAQYGGKKLKYKHNKSNYIIEIIVLFTIYILLSSKKIKEYVSKYVGINVNENVTISGIALYGAILTLSFMIGRDLILFVKRKFVDK